MKIVALDTDVLVHWTMAGAQLHRVARAFVSAELEAGHRLGLTQHVLAELIHIVTDRRRFERPLEMKRALGVARSLWRGAEVERLVPGDVVVDRALELLQRHRLGRKRILDTLLAATLEQAGVLRLATFNESDYSPFAFLEVVVPA